MIYCAVCQAEREPPHTHCASCGVLASAGFCTHHASPGEDHWSATNRVMCDGLHRDCWPARLAASDREAVTVETETVETADVA